MIVIDATYFPKNKDRESFLAGDRLHPELPEFVQGSWLHADLVNDHEKIAAWLKKHNGIATMGYEVEHFKDPRMLPYTVQQSGRIYTAAGVQWCNYEVTAGWTGVPIPSCQCYRWPKETDRNWFDRSVDHYRTWEKSSLGPMAVWINTHELVKASPGGIDSYAPPRGLKDMRKTLTLLGLLEVKYVILWCYSNCDFSPAIPAFVAAMEMM